jgi:hypothetical protein
MIKPYSSRLVVNVRSIELRLMLFIEKRLAIAEGWFRMPRGRSGACEPGFLQLRAARCKPIAIPLPQDARITAPLLRPQRVNVNEYFRHLGCTIQEIPPEELAAFRERMREEARLSGAVFHEPPHDSRDDAAGTRYYSVRIDLSGAGVPLIEYQQPSRPESVHDALARFGFYSGKPRYMN